MAVIKKTRRNTQTARVEEIYSDLTTPFYINSNTLDLIVETNEDAVKASIKNILLKKLKLNIQQVTKLISLRKHGE